MAVSGIYKGTVYKNAAWAKPGLGASTTKEKKFTRLSKAELKALKEVRKSKR